MKGKILVVAGLPAELAAAQAAGRGGGRGGAAPNPLGVENTDFVTPQGYAVEERRRRHHHGPDLPAVERDGGAGHGPRRGAERPAVPGGEVPGGRPAAVPTITAGVALTNALFQGERMSGAQVFEGAAAGAKLDSFELNAEKESRSRPR